MFRLALFITLSLLLCTHAQQFPNFLSPSSSSSNTDIHKCLVGLSNLEPYIVLFIEEVETADPNVYLANLKDLYNIFRAVAGNCGIELPQSNVLGNPALCKQDLTVLTNLLKGLADQSKRSLADQNLISVLTIYMSLANNLPKALNDCTPH